MGDQRISVENELRPSEARRRWGQNAWMVALGVICQIATVLITWPLWQVRSDVPHLPTFELPQFSFGPWMIATAGLVLFKPRLGLATHWAVLIAAAVFDQFRLQPQFFLIAALMSAFVWESWQRIARWILASTWLWAGIHKLVSEDWFGHVAFWMLERISVEPETWSQPVAYGIAISEILLGVFACFRPRWAALICVPIHLGIIAFLLAANWNHISLAITVAVAIKVVGVLRRDMY